MEEEEKSWIEDLKEQLLLIKNVDEEKKWVTQSIFRVPSRIKDANLKMYEPQMVAIGPYHHNNPKLKPMEHLASNRAVVRLLEKSKKPIEEYGAALESMVQQLMDAYEVLEDVWMLKIILLADGDG